MRLLTKMLVDDEATKQNKDIEISFSRMFRETTK
jgi:LacI family transcriptional regulator